MTAEFDKQIQETHRFFGDLRFTLDQMIPNDDRGYIARLMIFKDIVKKNAKFDLKNHGYSESEIGRISLYHGKKFRFDDYGNYNFGVAARAFGIDLNVSLRGAGVAQVQDGTAFWGNFSGWFDDPRDAQKIIQGYNVKF